MASLAIKSMLLAGPLSFAAAAAGAMGGGGAGAPAERGDLDDLLWPTPGPSARTDHRGRALTAPALRDKLVVLSFVSAGCTIVCALRTMDLDKLARALPEALRGRVVFLALDTDPAQDDAARLRTFGDGLVGPDSPLRILASDAAATSLLAATLRYPARSLPEPPPMVFLFDRRGRIAMNYGGDPLDGPRLLRDLAVVDTFANGLDAPPAAASADAGRSPL